MSGADAVRGLDRRTLLAAPAGLAASTAIARSLPPAERLPLWPDRPPGAEGPIVEDVFVRRSANGPSDDVAWTHVGAPDLKERHVGASTPPTFVCNNADNPAVPFQNGLMMFTALQVAGVPTELMIAEKGGHGPTLVDASGRPHAWFGLLETFAARHGWTGESN